MNKSKALIFTILAILLLALYPANHGIRAVTVNSSEFSKQKFSGVMQAYTFASPDCSFNALKSLIDDAEKSIFIELYSFSNPYLLDILGNMSLKGVNIKIILQENHASYFEDQYTYWAAHELYKRGIDVYWAGDEYTFTHAKYAILDNSTVIVMSENWAKSGVPIDPSYGNRGWGIAINNSDLANYFLDVFIYDLSIAEPYDPSSVDHGKSVSYSVPKGDYEAVKNMEVFKEYMEVIPVLSPDFSEQLIIDLINSANESLLIEQMYIYSTLTNLVNAIISAKNRGVEVKVILDPRSSENNVTAQQLINAGIDVAFANTSLYGSNHMFETMHNKGVIVDHKAVLISSINWSPNSLRNNREVGLVVFNENITKYYEDLFYYDWNNAAEYLQGQPVTQPGEGVSENENMRLLLIATIVVIILFIMLYLKKR